jgi:hypothetical protein
METNESSRPLALQGPASPANPFSRSLTSRSTKLPSSVSSFPKDGNLPPTTRPFCEVETASPALDLATTFVVVEATVAFDFFTDVERGVLAAEAGALRLVETMA